MSIPYQFSTIQIERIVRIVLFSLVILGVAALVCFVLFMLWLIVQAIWLMSISIIETGGIIANLYQQADPLIRLTVLTVLVVTGYRMTAPLFKSRRKR